MARFRCAVGKAVEAGQNMELDIGRAGAGAVGEPTGFHHIRRQQPAFGQQILQHMCRRLDALVLAKHRGKGHLGLHGGLQMVLIILTHAGQICDHFNPKSAQVFSAAYARKLQDFWRGQGTRRQDHLTRNANGFAIFQQNTIRFAAVKQNLVDTRCGADRQVWAPLRIT